MEIESKINNKTGHDETDGVMNAGCIKEICNIIPHRPPFLFVDEIIEISGQKIITKTKIKAEYDFFKGHYPQNPIVPGVILCEMAFQSGAILIAKLMGESAADESNRGKMPVVTRISEVKFRKMIKPGDSVETTVELVEKAGSAYFMKAMIASDGKNAVQCEFAVSSVKIEGGA